MRKYTAKPQQLDEIDFIKNMFKKKDPGYDKNQAAREQLKKRQNALYGEIQNYLGLRGMDLNELTPKLLARFLNSYDINVSPSDIPADMDGTVERSVLDNIVRDITIKSLSGEPLTYEPPTQTRALGVPPAGNRPQPAPTATPAATQDVESYLNNWIKNVSSAVDDDAKADLAREFAAFLAQKVSSPDGALDVTNAIASTKTPAAAPKAASAPAASTPSKPAKTKSAAGSKNKTSTASASSIPVMPKSEPAATPEPKAEPKSEPKAEPKSAAKPVPKAEPKAEPKSAAPKPAAKPVPKKTKGKYGVTLPPNMPGTKEESIHRVAKAIKEGKQIDSGLKITAHDYKYFIKILETMNLTLKDIGLWRVLKESSDQYVVLQTR
jgi:hypothetical protein